MKRVFGLVLAFLLLPGLLGCFRHLYGETMQGVDLTARQRIYVVNQPKDKRLISSMIADRLLREGFEATAGMDVGSAPAGVDAIVTYEDHWQWDMSNYLIVLRIDFRDPATHELLASGQSYRTSFARKSPASMVDEIITAMFDGR